MKQTWNCPACQAPRTGDCPTEHCQAQWKWRPGMYHLGCEGQPNLLGIYKRRCWCNIMKPLSPDAKFSILLILFVSGFCIGIALGIKTSTATYFPASARWDMECEAKAQIALDEYFKKRREARGK